MLRKLKLNQSDRSHVLNKHETNLAQNQRKCENQKEYLKTVHHLLLLQKQKVEIRILALQKVTAKAESYVIFSSGIAG